MRLRRLVRVGSLAAVAALPPAAVGQEVPTPADLSSVVTLAVEIPPALVPGTGETEILRFELRPAPGFRLLGPPRGELSLRAGDVPVLPVTVSVGGSLEAGPREAVVAVLARDGTRDSAVARVEIRPRRGLALRLSSDRPEVRLGERMAVRFEVANRGNAPDTVRLAVDTRIGTVRGLPAFLVVEPFGRSEGSFQVDVEAPSLAGSSAGILVTARGAGPAVHERLAIPVRLDEGPFDRWARIPTSVFVGTSLYPGTGSLASSPAFGIESGGLLRPDVRLSVSAHGAPPDVSGFAFRGYPLGPRFRAELATRHLDLAGGQIFTRVSSLAGASLQGAGGRVVVRTGRVTLLAHAAAPLDAGGEAVGGHQLLSEAGIRTPAGAFGTQLLLEDRGESRLAPSRRLASALLTYRSSGPSAHSLSAEAGWMRIAIPGTSRPSEGPALHGRYTFARGPHLLDLTARLRPATDSDRGLPPNEVRLQGLLGAWRHAGLLGEAYLVDRPRTSGTLADRIRGLALGVWLLDGPNRFEIRGREQASSGPVSTSRRTVEGLATVQLGSGFLDARAEAGEVSTGGRRGPLVRLDAGWNLRSERGWGRAGLLLVESPASPAGLSVQLAGSYRLAPRVEIYGSATSSVTRFDIRRSVFAELGTEVDIGAGLSALAAVERAEGLYGSGATRVSVGVRKGLPLPVPVRQPGGIQGIVFEDANGNGRFDPGEPLLDGVRLTMGSAVATTREGRFEFRETAGRGPLRVDGASLGSEFVPPGPVLHAGDELVPVPVYRGAALRARLFVDEDRDGVQDPTEIPLLGASIRIERAGEEAWEIPVGPDGGVALSSIRPGSWTIRVVPESVSGRLAAPAPLTLSVLGGEDLDVRIPVSRREVRFHDAATGADEAGAETPAD